MYVPPLAPTTTSTPSTTAALDYQATDKDLVAVNIYYVPVNNTFYNGPQRASNFFYHNALNYSTGPVVHHTFSEQHAERGTGGYGGLEMERAEGQPAIAPWPAQRHHCAEQRRSFSNQTAGERVRAEYRQHLRPVDLNFKDVVTKVYKSHALKFGGQYTRLAYLDPPTWAPAKLLLRQLLGLPERRAVHRDHIGRSAYRHAYGIPEDDRQYIDRRVCAGRLEVEAEPDREPGSALGVLRAA